MKAPAPITGGVIWPPVDDHGDTDGRTTGFLFDDANGVGVYYWIDGDRGYALAGDLDRETLRKVATQAYEHMAY